MGDHDGTRERGRMRTRWFVHLTLIGAFAASLATVVMIPAGRLHIVVGLVFVALAGVHVAQRRRTVARLIGALARAGGWFTRRGRLAWSDLVLVLLSLNLLVSGTYDWLSGEKVMVQPREIGIPVREFGWHALSAIVLLVYLCVHVARRWDRVRRSTIR
jgi:hypothetical protein